MPSLFSKIIAGEIPCYKVAESEDYLAFLDIFPLKEGHTLVIPKKEVDYFYDLDDDLLAGLMVFSKGVAAAIRSSIDCARVGVSVVGLEIPHAHVHLIPIYSVKDMDFSKEKLKFSPEELAATAARIRENYKG